NKQFFTLGRVHRAHCSIDMLGIGSALYKTPLKRRVGTLGVKQADSSHIPQPAIAGLGFAPFATLTYAKLRLALRAPSG
ncbi:MAG: hypothetical protein IKK06_04610, partial [Clostridia bacterium]|nr:hypothetical protein [Clostridia bacterium]